MTIAVTGTTGHLGRLVIKHLLAGDRAPADVVALARNVPRAAEVVPAGVEVRLADYDQPETLAPALAEVETLVLVSSSEVGQRVRQHRAVIDAAIQAGVRRIVYTSMMGADRATVNPLATSHRATEDYLQTSGLQFTILRNGWYTENFVDSARQAIATGELIGSADGGRVASAARDDYAAAAAVVAASPGHEGTIYTLSGDTAWSYSDLAVMLTELSGRDVVYRDLSEQVHADTLVALTGLSEALAGFIATIDQSIKAGELAEMTGELSVLIGRSTTPPAVTLADALSVAD